MSGIISIAVILTILLAFLVYTYYQRWIQARKRIREIKIVNQQAIQQNQLEKSRLIEQGQIEHSQWVTAQETIKRIQLESEGTIKAIRAIASIKVISGAIYQSLAQMDKTCNFYIDEDEANRELTSCLNILGHGATYQHSLTNGRACDIFVDNSIIEGKLDLNDRTQIDRLIGQVTDYLALPYNIYIVLYGQVALSIIERINTQLVDRYPNKVFLTYLVTANRIRQMI